MSLVFDNMKTVVKRIDEEDDPVWNETLFKFATELGFHPIACTPNQPNQKGSVENLVKYVKNNFLPGRIFSTRNDLKNRLKKWLHTVNEERECQATERIPAKLLEERELEKLQPLKATSDTYGKQRSYGTLPDKRVLGTGGINWQNLRSQSPPGEDTGLPRRRAGCRPQEVNG